MQHRMRERGHPSIGFAQVRLLGLVEPAGTRAVTLAARTGTTKQFTGRAVADLERRGFVEVTPDPNDRRASIVRLTAQGERFCADADAVKGELDARLAKLLGEAGAAQLADALQTLIAEAERENMGDLGASDLT